MKWKIIWVVSMAILMVIPAASLMIGREDAQNDLPTCQEDEYLYPVDYTGPGNNVESDYRCVNIEEAVLQAMHDELTQYNLEYGTNLTMEHDPNG
jgi:hypothetical protein